jgi:hypothetical protein
MDQPPRTISQSDLERVASSFSAMLKEKGLSHTMQYLDAIEAGHVPLPKGVPMTVAEFVDCGRTGCKVYFEREQKNAPNN